MILKKHVIAFYFKLELSKWYLDIHAHSPFSHHEFKLLKSHGELQSLSYTDDDSEKFFYVEYVFEFERHSTYATHLFIAPTVVVSLITPLIFLLPQESGEKITFGQ